KEEGLPEKEWCYEPNPEGKDALGMKLRANYLSLTGYRLPTEAEWEYACRAGAVTSRFFGETGELLRHYASYPGKSGGGTWPWWRRKPNDLGLFDMHGNIWVWCQEGYKEYDTGTGSKPVEDTQDVLNVNDQPRVIRGGSFANPASTIRSADRDGFEPTKR